jgi:hypothetical protein
VQSEQQKTTVATCTLDFTVHTVVILVHSADTAVCHMQVQQALLSDTTSNQATL